MVGAICFGAFDCVCADATWFGDSGAVRDEGEPGGESGDNGEVGDSGELMGETAVSRVDAADDLVYRFAGIVGVCEDAVSKAAAKPSGVGAGGDDCSGADVDTTDLRVLRRLFNDGGVADVTLVVGPSDRVRCRMASESSIQGYNDGRTDRRVGLGSRPLAFPITSASSANATLPSNSTLFLTFFLPTDPSPSMGRISSKALSDFRLR